MTTPSRRILFLGGPGNISDSTIRHFLRSDAVVGVVKRRPDHLLGYDGKIEVYLGDRDNEIFLSETLATFRPDILIDATCFDPQQAHTVIRALSAHRPDRLIFVSTADVYGYPLSHLPMREDHPWNAAAGDYAINKKACEEIFRQALDADNHTSLTIIRPGYSLGKTFAMTAFGIHRGGHLVSRLRRGLPILSPGDGTTLLDVCAAHNTGLMIAHICESDLSRGRDYTCGHYGPTTYDEYLHAFAEAVGVEPLIEHIPTDFILSLDHPQILSSALRDLTQHHLYFSVERFRTDFPDFTWEYSLADAARDFIAYQESINGFARADQIDIEDQILRIWQEGKSKMQQQFSAQVIPG